MWYETFDVIKGGFVYLPQGIKHGYIIRSDGTVRLLVITFPPRLESGQGWDGFVADIEHQGKLIAKPDGLDLP